MKLFLIPLVLFILFSCKTNSDQSQYIGVPTNEIEKLVTNHLNNWFPRVIDNKAGGYYTNFEYNWDLSDDQNKMIVTQARDLWTASKAALLFPNDPKFKKSADHGFQFITENMWDKAEGGFQLYFDPKNPENNASYKLLYGNAFVLFAFAEYAKISPSAEVYSWINKLMEWMDIAAHDNSNMGYFNLILNKKLKENTPENKEIIASLGWGNPNWKDQNTSIHLLEAFATAYEVMPVPEIRTRLEEMLHLVRDTMVQPNGTLKLYFTADWMPIDYADSTREFILEHKYTDHISFGHNIETAYLIIDAAEKLYGRVDEKTLNSAKLLTDHTLKYGFAPNYYGLYDKGYIFNGELEIIGREKTWWSQAEALHTLALMNIFFPEEEQYKIAFQQMWSYINAELLDHKNGGFYNNGLDESPNNKKQRKGHNWKGSYHDGRALMNILEYSRNSEK